MQYKTVTTGKFQAGDEARYKNNDYPQNVWAPVLSHAWGWNIENNDQYIVRRPIKEKEPNDWW